MFRDLSPSILSWGAVRNTASEKIGEALDALLPILRAAPQLNERLEEAYLTEFFDSTAELHKVPTYEKGSRVIIFQLYDREQACLIRIKPLNMSEKNPANTEWKDLALYFKAIQSDQDRLF